MSSSFGEQLIHKQLTQNNKKPPLPPKNNMKELLSSSSLASISSFAFPADLQLPELRAELREVFGHLCSCLCPPLSTSS